MQHLPLAFAAYIALSPFSIAAPPSWLPLDQSTDATADASGLIRRDCFSGGVIMPGVGGFVGGGRSMFISPQMQKRLMLNDALSSGGTPNPMAPPTPPTPRSPNSPRTPNMPPVPAIPNAPPIPRIPGIPGGAAGTIYLSNDDSLSLASPQRIIAAITGGYPINPSEIRPHEFLNYFAFAAPLPANKDNFGIQAELAQDTPPNATAQNYGLAIAVQGRTLSKKQRQTAVLNLIIDRSGSMLGENRMDYLRQGLVMMLGQLKRGDMVNILLFDHQLCAPVEHFEVGKHDEKILRDTFNNLAPRGSTNLQAALSMGYLMADRHYDASKNNRVVLITDALANTGVVDAAVIADIGKHYDQKRIGLSGIGVGKEFNDSLFDELTEAGKGAYLFLGGAFAAKKVFEERFVSLLEPIARDVRVALRLPKSLRMETFFGEEASTDPQQVKPLHFFAGSSQLYLANLTGAASNGDKIGMDIGYRDPQTGAERSEHRDFAVAELLKQTPKNLNKGRLLMRFTDLLLHTSQLNPTQGVTKGVVRNNDFAPAALHKYGEQCRQAKQQMSALASADDVEQTYVMNLLRQYCQR